MLSHLYITFDKKKKKEKKIGIVSHRCFTEPKTGQSS